MSARKYQVNESAFLNNDDISYYLLGAYMSDGNVFDKPSSRFFCLYSIDKDWLESVRDIISPQRPLTKRNNLYIFKSNSAPVLNWLIRNKCIPNKSLKLEMPDVPQKYFPDFIRGYFDGDGSACLTKYKKIKKEKEYWYPKFTSYICTGSKSFAEKLVDRLADVGFKPCLCVCYLKPSMINNKIVNVNGPSYRISFGDQSAIKFTNWTHYDGHSLSMPRKWNKIKEAREIFEKRPGQGWNKKI